MKTLLVVVEHRKGVIRDITFEMLGKAGEICKTHNLQLTAVVLGWEVDSFLSPLSERADTVLVLKREEFKQFDADLYKEALNQLIAETQPWVTLMGQTSWGLDLAPCLAVKTGFPLASDCLDLLIDGERLTALRQRYGGKIFTKVSFTNAPGVLLTIRPGAFPADKPGTYSGEIIQKELTAPLPQPRKKFLEYLDSGAGEIDIAQADFLISVGRGMGEEDNLAEIKEFVQAMGGTLSCSRPIVDKKWLPKYHQVGTSGKSVKPKVYLALGISGAFQHVAGISGAGTVIAVNRDPKAPIFRVAQYGVVADMFKIIPALREKLGA
jgi:electron transfer flavoprotein alpha subunit